MYLKLEWVDLMSAVLKIYMSVYLQKKHSFLVKKETCFCVI